MVDAHVAPVGPGRDQVFDGPVDGVDLVVLGHDLPGLGAVGLEQEGRAGTDGVHGEGGNGGTNPRFERKGRPAGEVEWGIADQEFMSGVNAFKNGNYTTAAQRFQTVYGDAESLQAFRAESENYRPVAEAVQELLDKGRLSPEAHQTIHGFLGNEGEALLTAVNDGDIEASARLVRELLDRHGTGRVLFRNTRAAVQGFPERKLHAYALPCPDEYLELPLGDHDELYPEDSYQAQPEASEEERWWKFDQRVEWLIDQLKMLKRTKVLVICAHAETAMDLEDALRVRSGIPATVFHEGMNILERDRAAAYFADEEFGAQVLICSEIGSEGRNFQFAHHLVLFDLPINPELLEQRIGRLDRIGQTEDIKIHIPVIKGSPQEILARWYHEGVDAFSRHFSGGAEMGQKFGERVLEVRGQPAQVGEVI